MSRGTSAPGRQALGLGGRCSPLGTEWAPCQIGHGLGCPKSPRSRFKQWEPNCGYLYSCLRCVRVPRVLPWGSVRVWESQSDITAKKSQSEAYHAVLVIPKNLVPGHQGTAVKRPRSIHPRQEKQDHGSDSLLLSRASECIYLAEWNSPPKL